MLRRQVASPNESHPWFGLSFDPQQTIRHRGGENIHVLTNMVDLIVYIKQCFKSNGSLEVNAIEILLKTECTCLILLKTV